MGNKKSRFAGIGDIHKKLSADPESQPRRVTKMGRPPGKKSDPAFKQVTVYLRKDTHDTARKILFDDRRQFSDLVDELVSRWISGQKARSSKV